MPTKETHRNILVTGASGYVGGRLRRRLERLGLNVRCLTRHPEHLLPRVAAGTEVTRGDLLEPSSLAPAFSKIDVAYYLVHSMASSGDFSKLEAESAQNFSAAAKASGVRRIIYLGALGRDRKLSRHLESRQTVGRILRESGVPTVELRASIVIGSGSLSFEMVRALVDKLPVMLTPRWVRIEAQPIAIEDVLDYLVEAREIPLTSSRIFEIGGADRSSYSGIMKEYAHQRGLRRLILPVPVLTPSLSSLWLGLFTTLCAKTGRKLIQSIRNPTTVEDHSALEVFSVQPRSLSTAIYRALVNEDLEFAETRWSDALSHARTTQSYGGVKLGSRLVDSRQAFVPVSRQEAFRPIMSIGGQNGWYYANWLWYLRGLMDSLVGGPGLRRGRRHPTELHPGDAVDFWRVEAIEPDQMLRLHAEMRLPGRAWLQFEVEELPHGRGSTIRQTAIFDPLGLLGLGYWYSLWVIHQFVFKGMLEGLARAALEDSRQKG